MSGAEQPATPASEEQKDAQQVTQSFMAGFADDEDTHQPTEPTALPADASASDAAAPVAPKYVQVTEEEWSRVSSSAAKIDEVTATLGKRLDDARGEMGGLKRRLSELQTVTPKGESVQLGDDDFAELKGEYPELGELTVKGLNRVLGKLKGTGTDPAAIEKAVAPLRDDMLEMAFPGWKDEVRTPDFKDWLTGQDETVKALAASDSHADAARLLRKFTTRTKTEAAKPAAARAARTPAAPAASAQPSMRSRQIAAAVAPRGDSAAPPSTSGKTPFQAGFDDDD